MLLKLKFNKATQRPARKLQSVSMVRCVHYHSTVYLSWWWQKSSWNKNHVSCRRTSTSRILCNKINIFRSSLLTLLIPELNGKTRKCFGDRLWGGYFFGVFSFKHFESFLNNSITLQVTASQWSFEHKKTSFLMGIIVVGTLGIPI